MSTYDVVNEAIIAATPAEVASALMQEAAGRSRWWQPSLRMRQRGDQAVPTEEWTLEPADAGRTRITTRWKTDPQGRMRLLARFADVPGIYSSVMREGFRGIELFTAQARAGSEA